MKDSEKSLDERPVWEQNPELYQFDALGNIIFNKNGSPRKKMGKKKGSAHNWHSATKARMDARRKINKKKKEVVSAQRRVESKKQRLKALEEAHTKIDAGNGKIQESAVATPDDLIALPETLREQINDGVISVAFKPNPGPQTEFLAAPELDVLYGGAAGGGKSYAMLVDPLRYVHRKAHRFLILRKTLGELRELIDKSRELYPVAFPGAKYKEQARTWEFPSGAKGYFGYLEKDADVYQYQGLSFSWIGFDEITHLPSEFPWAYLASRLRTTDPEITCYLRCTANPGGPGHAWVKKRYVEPSSPNTPFEERGLTRKFIPARLSDNPHLYDDGNYQTMLESLPETERRRLLDGDWDIHDGVAFPEFRRSTHVIPPFEIPIHWERVKAIDYGYAAPSCVLWGAVDPEDRTLFIYKELYMKGLEPSQLALKITEMEKEEIRSIPGIIDGQCFARTGHTGPTQAEVIIKSGHKLRRADKNRKGGKIQIHEWLRARSGDRPGLVITSSCPNLIRELSTIPLKENDPEDVDTRADDHAYDALRYMIMSRPRREGIRDRMARYKSEVWVPFDPVVGY